MAWFQALPDYGLARHFNFRFSIVRFVIVDPVQRVGRFALIVFEIALLSALILATRCANYQDVFVAGNVYFADADCYARMTRVRMCQGKAGVDHPAS